MKSILKKIEFVAWYESQMGDALAIGERQEILMRLLEHHAISRLDWAVAKEILIDKEIWQGYIQDLKKEKPIQYILGYEYFAGKKFKVNDDVLIPRPETEELVKWIVQEHKKAEDLNILEIGTGSGCIAISLKKSLEQATILATDISDAALQVARANAHALQVSIEFIKDDILNSKIEMNQFDLIVSNPPYIPLEEAIKLDARVKNYEPHIALFTEENSPLQFYDTIILKSKTLLKPKGVVYFEVHEDYAQDVKKAAIAKNMEVVIRKDLYGKERMLCLTAN